MNNLEKGEKYILKIIHKKENLEDLFIAEFLEKREKYYRFRLSFYDSFKEIEISPSDNIRIKFFKIPKDDLD